MISNDDVRCFWKFGFFLKLKKVKTQSCEGISPNHMYFERVLFPRFSGQKDGNWNVENQQGEEKHQPDVNLKCQSKNSLK